MIMDNNNVYDNGKINQSISENGEYKSVMAIFNEIIIIISEIMS